MHARFIPLSAWADVHEDLEQRRYAPAGPALVTTGEHPEFGMVVAVQMMDQADGVHLLSEVPFRDDVDRLLAERDDEIMAPVRALFSPIREGRRLDRLAGNRHG